LRVVALNIKHGGGSRLNQLLDRLKKYQADVIVLTEYRNNLNSELIKKSLKNSAYIYQFTSAISDSNSVLIASKKSSKQLSLSNIENDDKHRVCLIQVGSIKIMGVYFAQKIKKKSLFDYINNEGSNLLADKGLIIGDFNTGIIYLDEKDDSFFCSKEFQDLEANGFIDAWRSRNPNKSEFSWYSDAGNGFRIDHAFCTIPLNKLVSHIQYDHEPRLKLETDHSALIIDFK